MRSARAQPQDMIPYYQEEEKKLVFSEGDLKRMKYKWLD